MAKCYHITFEVRPRERDNVMRPFLPFPLDMLRREGCFPATEEDSAKIAMTLSSLGRSITTPEERRIKLATVKHGWPKWHPTDGRWISFGWEVNIQSVECNPMEVG
jgi:hypothetical protein